MKNFLMTLFMILFIAIAGVVGYFAGQTLTKSFIDEQSTSLKHINERVVEEQQKLDNLIKDEKTKRQDLEAISQDLKSAKELIAQRDKIKDELAKLSDTNKQIEAAKQELERTTKAIITAKDEPKTLSAGQYTVGQDFEAGRYKIESNAQSDSSGILNTSISEAHVTLGNNKYSQKEYVVTLVNGETMDVTIPVKLIKIIEKVEPVSE